MGKAEVVEKLIGEGKREKKNAFEMCKVSFSFEQINELAQTMAQDMEDLKNLKDQRKAALSEYDSQIKKKELGVLDAGRMIRDGYKMEYMELQVFMDDEAKKVHYFIPGTNVEMKSRDMRNDELQRKLPMEPETTEPDADQK